VLNVTVVAQKTITTPTTTTTPTTMWAFTAKHDGVKAATTKATKATKQQH